MEAETAQMDTTETLEELQIRHKKEQRDLISRITQKKKQATKKTRKGVNDECAELERQLKIRQEDELRALTNPTDGQPTESESEDDDATAPEPQNQEPTADDLLSRKLASTTLTSPPTPPQQQQPQQQGPKRNRQKERLARRQAEVEAASAAAAAEASTMTDHRGSEAAKMEPVFQSNNLTEHQIAPDGHCLFSAFADQLSLNHIPLSATTSPRVAPYKILRQTAAGYMASHADDFAGFLEEPLDSYVEKIRNTAEWGGQLELSALANAYGVEVRVVQEGRTEVIRPSGEMGGDEDDVKTEEGGKKVVWLAYYRHGYGLGEHYNSLRRKQETSVE